MQCKEIKLTARANNWSGAIFFNSTVPPTNHFFLNGSVGEFFKEVERPDIGVVFAEMTTSACEEFHSNSCNH